MNFEYDENKSKSNKLKHNIDFEETKELWDDPYAIEIPSLNNQDEDRFLVLGKIDLKHYTAIITYRNENIRIISVRRSRKKEVKLYESIRIG
ncbi:BrnT family toxin [Candidatus Halobeggiatoa sp. HSG11]|nr:BrnT family toxin [Candidatus Halobeggiatoa sp. HSG11]